MDFEIWQIWLLAGFILFIAEIFIPGIVIINMGVGCLASSLISAFGAPLWMQLIGFIIATVLSFIFIAPYLKKLSISRKNEIKTNVHGFTGRIAKVVTDIDNEKDQGYVAIDGDIWKAVSINNSIITEGTKVVVCEVNSIIMIVKPIEPPKVQVDLPVKKSEVIVSKTGTKEKIFNPTDFIAFYSEDKTTFGLSEEGKSIILDESLDKIEKDYNYECFFRVNRQFILHYNSIKELQSSDYGKINVLLKPIKGLPQQITVSRLKASQFRQWINKLR